jgi:RNA polymerase sigma-70 factor, ECF subfamily
MPDLVQTPRELTSVRAQRAGPAAAATGRRDTCSIDALKDVSDAKLVEAILNADEDALAEVYKRHADASRMLARRLAREPALAEEVVQEVFLRLWRRADRYEPTRGSLRSYLLATTHGRALDAVRSESARRQREQREAQMQNAPAYDLEREVIARTTATQVRDALATIPENERRAVELAYFGGHSYREVADLLGEPEGTVKSRIRSGLSRLRRAMQTLDGPGPDE